MPRKKGNEPIEQYDFVDQDLIDEKSEEYGASIGNFLIEFSALEHTLNLLLADRINERAHEPGYQVIELLTTKNKIALLSRMCSLYMTYIQKENPNLRVFKVLVRRLNELNSFRNKIAHANWMTLSREGTVRTRIIIDSEGGMVEFERTPMTPELIDSKVDELVILGAELEEFFENDFLKNLGSLESDSTKAL